MEMNLSTCLGTRWGDLGRDTSTATTILQNNNNIYCPPVWDGLLCWPPTPPGTIAHSNCPAFKGSDITKSAFRVCTQTGEWLNRDGIESSSSGWTNYTLCMTPEIREIMRRLGSDHDAQIKYKIATNTRILEFVGLSLSLAALLISLLIFYFFRTLRNSRTRLHRHLFIAMVIQVAIRLTLYTDQAITRRPSSSVLMTSRSNTTTTTSMMRGIDNTPILCEATYISLEYARTAMFMWMFVEGLFLHNMITVTVFEEKLSPLVYPVIGWIIPIPLTVTWGVVTYFHYGAAATCWWGYNFTLYFWILEGPRLAVLVVNLAFLLNILRVLIIKLRQSNSSELQQALKAVKAALLLLPLLGLTNLLNMLEAPLEKSPLQFAVWSYSTHLLTSTQGLVLAFLYCFRNGEVQLAIKKLLTRRTNNFLRRRRRPASNSNKKRQIINRSSVIPLSTLLSQQQELPPSTSIIIKSSSPSPQIHSSSFTKPLNQTTSVAAETQTANNNNNNDVNQPLLLLHPQTNQHHHQVTMTSSSSPATNNNIIIPPPPPPSNLQTKEDEKSIYVQQHPSSSSWRFLVVVVPKLFFGGGGGDDDVKVNSDALSSCDDDDDGDESVVVVVDESNDDDGEL